MKNNILIALLFTGFCTLAQPGESRTDAIERVFKILTTTDAVIDQEKLAENLEQGAWEALSYIEEKGQEFTTEDLQEAVPDYYHFEKDKVRLKLINPKDNNEYGMQLDIIYKLNKNTIELFKKGSLEVKDRWKILYLDANYLALDMGTLRVFFTHTPNQE